jgi:hypothetical protein
MRTQELFEIRAWVVHDTSMTFQFKLKRMGVRCCREGRFPLTTLYSDCVGYQIRCVRFISRPPEPDNTTLGARYSYYALDSPIWIFCLAHKQFIPYLAAEETTQIYLILKGTLVGMEKTEQNGDMLGKEICLWLRLTKSQFSSFTNAMLAQESQSIYAAESKQMEKFTQSPSHG